MATMSRLSRLSLVVLTLLLGLQAAPVRAQERPSIEGVLRAAALTEADVPRGLALDASRSGSRLNDQGWPRYTAAFVGNGTDDPSLMGVINILGQAPDAATGMERLAEQFQSGLGGNRTDMPAPGLGEGSRAFAVITPVMGGAVTTSTVFVAVRRADVVAGVAVSSLGDAPRVDLAMRLARDIDGRLMAALVPRS
jgi:hypothetical protein